jgi:hypothetical protein
VLGVVDRACHFSQACIETNNTDVFEKTAIYCALDQFILASGVKEKCKHKAYPYGNPVIKHMYTADAAPKVMPDGKVWMVTSVDHEDGGGYQTMHCYHAFSSTDMVNWTDHGEIFNINDALQGKPSPKTKTGRFGLPI